MNDLEKIYAAKVLNENISLDSVDVSGYRLEDIYNKQILNEEVKVVFTTADGKKETFNLEDSYGKVIARQIRLNQDPGFDDNVKSLFVQGDWVSKKKQQGIARSRYKDIVIKSQYDEGVALTNYLANNKEKLLKLSDLPIAKVFSFPQAIASKLPREFVNPELNVFIQNVHYHVVPKASTGVGLGEGTFSIFGTATKGSSGDLQWDGSEVEIKTNGVGKGSGAILGGDGNINEITDRLEAKSDYINLDGNIYTRYKNELINIMDAYASQGKEQAQILYDKFRKGADQLKNMIGNSNLTGALDNTQDVEMFMNTVLSRTEGSFSALKKQSGSVGFPKDQLLPNRLLARLDKDIQTKAGQESNLPGQLASLLGADATVEDFIDVFSEMKTYKSTKTDVRSQLVEFFKSYNYIDFSPKTNYNNFQRLAGAIAIICYQEKIGFDYLTAGNDDKMTMAIFNTQNPRILSIYKQLEDCPEVVFDLNIDVYEGGAYRSQTTIAKGPRIVLK